MHKNMALKPKIDLTKIQSPELMERTITFRITNSDYRTLKAIDRNLSILLRYMIKVFIEDYKTQTERINSWNKQENN